MQAMDQFIASQKTNMETLNDLSMKMFGDVQKMTELNMETTKSFMMDMHDQAQAMLSAKDMQELMAMRTDMKNPAMQKVADWGRQMSAIMSGAGDRVGKVMQERIEEQQEGVANFMDKAMKNMPMGSDKMSAMMKDAVGAANTAYDTMQRAAMEASDAAIANFKAAAETATKAQKTATTRAKKS